MSQDVMLRCLNNVPSFSCPNISVWSPLLLNISFLIGFLTLPLWKRSVDLTAHATTVSREPGSSVLVFLTFSLLSSPLLAFPLCTGVLRVRSLLILSEGVDCFSSLAQGTGS